MKISDYWSLSFFFFPVLSYRFDILLFREILPDRVSHSLEDEFLSKTNLPSPTPNYDSSDSSRWWMKLGNIVFNFSHLIFLSFIRDIALVDIFSLHFRISLWPQRRKLRRLRMTAMTKLLKNTSKKSTMMKIVVCKAFFFFLLLLLLVFWCQLNSIKTSEKSLLRASDFSFHKQLLADVRHLSEEIFFLSDDEVSLINHRYHSLEPKNKKTTKWLLRVEFKDNIFLSS